MHEEDKVMEKEQAFYRSGVGTLLYLTKHSRPDMTNAVRVKRTIQENGWCIQITTMRTQKSWKICVRYQTFVVAHCTNHG